MKNTLLFLFVFLSVSWNIFSQVDTFSKQVIDGVIVYKDLKKPLLYYYAPSNLQLVVDETSKPDFQMLKMRYVGTQCSNDEDFSHTTNLVQLRIEMPSQPKGVLSSIKSKLGRNIKLKPIRITGVDSKLLVPVKGIDSLSKSIVIGETTNSSIDSKKSLSTSKSYWTERVFSFSLSEKEATILESQLNDRTLALSFNYSFYAMTTNPLDDVVLKGAQEILDNIKKDEEEYALLNRIFFSDSFEIMIDVEKWPDLVKEIDINESVPPAYAAVEIKCYDFYENLRPDLYLKIIEVKTRSVDDSKDITIEAKFYSKQPELNTKRIYFPYAVLVGEPFKYRINEYTLEGKKSVGEWQTTDSCSAIIDVTTPAEDLTSEKFDLEIEADTAWFSDQNDTIVVTLSYTLNDKPQNEMLEFVENDNNKEVSFYHDIDTSIEYSYKVISSESILFSSEKIESNDIYLFISKE